MAAVAAVLTAPALGRTSLRGPDTAEAAAAAALPSGRSGPYRSLPDYGNEMKALAAANPGLVKPLQLPHKTYEGRTVEGVEITTDPNARDGKPVFLLTGLHHARDWPAGEHAMEWVHELVNGYNAGNPRIRQLVESTRMIVVPIVNPDAFNMSRQAGEAQGGGGGRGGDEAVNIANHPYEYRRKNCRVIGDPSAGTCAQPSPGLAEPGVDPSRNYGLFWGGPGADTNPVEQTYRGTGPFSEAESRNIRDLLSSRQVTTLISNYAFGERVLRPPGVRSLGPAPDEALLKTLGDAMAAANDSLSRRTSEVSEASGTPDDWAYYSTGALAFSLEIGCNELDTAAGRCNAGNYRPPYATMASEYEGGNREAYFKALESTADAGRHAVLEGQAPPGAVLRLRKAFQTPTYPQADGRPILLEDRLDTALEVPASGRFEWHVNPSTRPLVAQERGRAASGSPSEPQTFSGTTAGPPPDGATPCGDADTTAASCFNEHAFTVPSGPGIDNARVRIRIEWANPGSDWDLSVFRDTDGDGSSADETAQPVAASFQGTTNAEEASFAEPLLETGASYVARVVNWAATEPYDGTITFEGPEPVQPASTESWTLTCELPDGRVLSQQAITIGRGQRAQPDLGECLRAPGGSDPVPDPTDPLPDPTDPLTDPAPSVLALALQPRTFRALSRGPSIRPAAANGARLTYVLSEPALATFRIERAGPGRRVGRRCTAPNSRNRNRRRCTRYTSLRGSFTHRGGAGTNRLMFAGRLRGRALRAGRYRLMVVATDSSGQRSAPRRTAFRIARR